MPTDCITGSLTNSITAGPTDDTYYCTTDAVTDGLTHCLTDGLTNYITDGLANDTKLIVRHIYFSDNFDNSYYVNHSPTGTFTDRQKSVTGRWVDLTN